MYMSTSVSHMDRMGEMMSEAGMEMGPRPSRGRSICTRRSSVPFAAAPSPATQCLQVLRRRGLGMVTAGFLGVPVAELQEFCSQQA